MSDLWGLHTASTDRVAISEHDVYDSFYDEEEDFSDPPEPHQGPWYHYSPHSLPVGTHLTTGHDSPWGDNYYEKDGTEHRRNYVWLSPSLGEAVGWAGTTPRRGQTGPGHIYRVEPHSDVLPWNGTGSDGWVAEGAHIAEEIPHPWKEPHTASRKLHTAADEDYRDSHQAPGPEDGAPMHDVTQGIYPASFYDEPFRYWGTDESTGDRDSWGTIHKVRGNPDARVKVHRALPLDVAKRERGIGLAAPLNTGDWVTPSYNYAHEHGMSRLEGNTPWTVVTSTVPASQLHTNGDSLAEWGYNGPPTQGYEGANAAGKRKYRQQQVRKQQINAETTKDFHHCGFCGSPSGEPCERGCWGKKKYPGERDVRGDLPDQPGVSGGGEIDYDPGALRDIRLSHRSTDGWGLHTAADPTLPPAFGEDTNVVHRMVGWDLPYVMRQRGHTPESIAQDLKRDPEGTAHSIFGSIEDNYGGIGHHFTRNPAMADYIADVKGDNHDFHVVFSGTHDPEDVNTNNDDLTGGEWPEEEETTLLPGSSVNIHQMKIRPSHSPDWTTVPMNRDSYASWDRNHTASTDGLRYAAVVEADVADDLARMRLAAVNQDLVDKLHNEFNQWAVDYAGPSEDLYGDRHNRGPIGEWKNVESFLHDRYPAAHKNHDYGQEEAAWALDGHEPMPYQLKNQGKEYGSDLTPYATGPEAVAQHGYDPAEIAASMVLLHNQSHPLRGNLAQEDQDRLTDIFDKRQQMQRDYDQRTKTAMPWYHRTDDELNPGDHLLPYNQVHPDHQEVGDESWNPNKAYVYYGEEDDSSDHAPYAGYGQHIYEIEPHDDPQRDYGDGNHSSHMTDGGTVIKRLPDEDPYSFGEEPQWADPIAHKYASRTASCSDDEYMHGQCAAWAVAHQREYPHLRFGIDWQRLTPDHPDWDEEDEGDEIWQPQHIFTHDDTHAYDVRGAHPLSDIKQWDDVTLNHSRNDVLSTGMHEMGWEPESDVVRRVSPHTAARTAMPWSQYEQSRNARLAMAWDEWAPQVRNDFYQHVSPEGLGKLSRPCEVGGCGGGSSLGAYWIDHGEGKQSHLTFTHRPQEKRIDVNLLGTHEDFQGDGVAESLMRRLHEDHPGMTINPGSMTGQGRGFHDRMLEKEPDARNVVTAGKNGPPPPMTFEPFNTMWTNGIMARHAEDGRPLAHLHWYPDGEIETIRVHPQMRGRDIGKAILTHAASHPDTYEASDGIKPSNTLTPDGRAFARSMGHNPTDEEVTPAEGEDQWAWKAVNKYVPMNIPYNGQNEDEMSRYLDQPWTPPAKTASVDDEGWPVWWRGRHRMAGPFDKRWHPNHPEHITAPWDS